MTDKEIVRAFFIEGYQKRNYDFIMRHVAEDYVDHSPAGARSNSDAVNILKIVEKFFGDLKIEIFDLIEENGMVSSRVGYDGIHTGEWMGVPATGKRIRFEALENFRLVDGRIVESWGYWPDAAILDLLAAEGKNIG